MLLPPKDPPRTFSRRSFHRRQSTSTAPSPRARCPRNALLGSGACQFKRPDSNRLASPAPALCCTDSDVDSGMIVNISRLTPTMMGWRAGAEHLNTARVGRRPSSRCHNFATTIATTTLPDYRPTHHPPCHHDFATTVASTTLPDYRPTHHSPCHHVAAVRRRRQEEGAGRPRGFPRAEARPVARRGVSGVPLLFLDGLSPRPAQSHESPLRKEPPDPEEDKVRQGEGVVRSDDGRRGRPVSRGAGAWGGGRPRWRRPRDRARRQRRRERGGGARGRAPMPTPRPPGGERSGSATTTTARTTATGRKMLRGKAPARTIMPGETRARRPPLLLELSAGAIGIPQTSSRCSRTTIA